VKALPIIIAVVVAVALVRLGLRRRRSSPRTGVAGTRLRGWGLLGDTGLVAGREIRERLRGRVFRVVTVILFGVVAAAVIIPTLRAGTAGHQRVGVVAGSAPLEAELHDLAKSVGLPVELVDQPGLPQARAALSAGQLDLVVDGTGKILVKDPVSASDTSAGARYLRAVSVTLGAQQAFARAGLTPQQAATVAKAKPVPVESIQPPSKKSRTTAESTALLGVILIFVVLTQYLTWTLMGVMEEKASRVVEVLLATVRPIQLLAGKVIGIGAVALTQAVALVAFALVLA